MKILLHTCCGPCAAWFLQALPESGYNVTGLFYNPNIHPRDEFDRRAGGAEKLYAMRNAPLVMRGDFMQSEWEAFGGANSGNTADSDARGEVSSGNTVFGENASAASPETAEAFAVSGGAEDAGIGAARCEKCYRTRISYTARLACEMRFDAFSTTLLISPYQKHDLIASICEEQSRECGVRFFYQDCRPHFRSGQKLAREAGLYMQKYCGCIFSA